MDFIYPKNLRFECNRCGICCGDTKEKTRHIIMLDSETREIQQKTGRGADEFCFEILDKQPYGFEMKKGLDGKCVFLTVAGCSIYDFRPLVCRFYPFELKFDETQQKYVFNATIECPALNQGKLLSQIEFRRLLWLAQDRLP